MEKAGEKSYKNILRVFLNGDSARKTDKLYFDATKCWLACPRAFICMTSGF